MWVIDDTALAAVTAGEPSYLCSPRRAAGDCLDLEILREPYLDAPDLDREFVDRVRRLRASFTDSPRTDLLVAYGSRSVHDHPPDDTLWSAALDRVGEAATHGVLTVPALNTAPEHDVASVFRVAETTAGTRAYVAVIGLGTHTGPDDQRGAWRLVRHLATSVDRNAPLYVIGVTDRDLLASDPGSQRLLRLCHRLRMSLVLHAGGGRQDLLTLSGTELVDRGSPAAVVSLVSAPTTKTGEGTPGMARIRIDVLKGEAEIAFRHDFGSDCEPRRPIQVVRPLLSASRVSASERRLYVKVRDLLAGAPDVEALRAHVESTWDLHGYTALTDADGRVPATLPVTRYLQYDLLFLLRQRGPGTYDILLSHHTPLRPPAVADWDTLLLPATRTVRDLLERLRDDVMRQAVGQADDLERAEYARSFEAAVESILERAGAERHGEVWADQVREVAALKGSRKISPTYGTVTQYDYRLVTLLPLVDQPTARGGGTVRDASKIVQWLRGLRAISRNGDRRDDTVSIDALLDRGAGLRWDPEAELKASPNAGDRRAAEKLPPGAIWFPIDLEKPWWEDCPAIAARNRDVMRFVDAELRKIWDADQKAFPAQFVLGQAPAAGDTFTVTSERYEFADAAQAVRNIKLTEHDLKGITAYPDADVRRVVLLRTRRGWPRPAIYVFDASDDDQVPTRAELETRAHLGVLRPVQRYVLESGLDRVKAIRRDVLEDLADADPWGFVRIRKGTSTRAAALTPPLIERLHHDDLDDSSEADYVVCDGNHRVVYLAWMQEQPTPAIAVVTEPAVPYYARPFGRLEWDCTADNRLVATPDQASKYAVRKVDLDDAGLDEVARALLKSLPEELRYRRYFRNLETGFGYMGGQGGRYV